MTEPTRGPIADPSATISEMLTDRRAWTDGAITPLIFLGANSLWGLQNAAVAAGAWGLAVAAYRLIRRQSPRYAVGGLFGLGLALFIALRTGTAGGYFLPNVVIGYLYGTAGLVSVLIGKPGSAALARLVEKKPVEWYRQPRVRNAHMLVTLVWTIFFLGRSSIRLYLIQVGSEAGLALTTVLLGPPPFALLAVGTWAFLRRRLASVPPPPEQTEPAPV